MAEFLYWLGRLKTSSRKLRLQREGGRPEHIRTGQCDEEEGEEAHDGSLVGGGGQGGAKGHRVGTGWLSPKALLLKAYVLVVALGACFSEAVMWEGPGLGNWE